MARILVVEDRPNVRALLAMTLRTFGHEVAEAGSIGEALERIGACRGDLVLSKRLLPDGHGVDLMSNVLEADPDSSFILFATDPCGKFARDAVQRGAYEVLPMPFSTEPLRRIVARAYERVALKRAIKNLERELEASRRDPCGGSAPEPRQIPVPLASGALG